MNVPPFCADVQPLTLEGQVAEGYSVEGEKRRDSSEKPPKKRTPPTVETRDGTCGRLGWIIYRSINETRGVCII